MAGRRAKHNPRHVAMALVAVAVLAVRGLIAPGFMPDMARAAKGEFPLVICFGGAKALGQLPGEVPANGQTVDEICPFAALGSLATLAEPIEVAGKPLRPVTQPAARSVIAAAPVLQALRARSPPYFRS